MTRKRRRPDFWEDRESLGCLGALGAGFVGYFGAEVSLFGRPHPLHWLVTGLAALIGFVVGQILPFVRTRLLRPNPSRPSRRR